MDGFPWKIPLKSPAGCLREVNFSADGQRLVSASSDRTARVWSAGSFGAAWPTCKGRMHARCMSYMYMSYVRGMYNVYAILQ